MSKAKDSLGDELKPGEPVLARGEVVGINRDGSLNVRFPPGGGHVITLWRDQVERESAMMQLWRDKMAKHQPEAK